MQCVAQRDVTDEGQEIALVGERRDRDRPAFVELSDEVLDWHANVVEEDLVELGLAGDLAQRPHRDARRLHVDQQEADALVFGGAGVGPYEQKAPVGDVGHAGPHFLAVHDEVIAVAHRARLQIGQIGARVRLREALAPELVGCQDLGQMALSLSRRAALHEGGAEHRDAAAAHELRRLGARHRLVEADALDGRRATAPRLPRPAGAPVAGLAHLLLPGAELLDFLASGARGRERAAAQVVGQVGLEPSADVLAKRFLPVREVEVHCMTTPPSTLRAWPVMLRASSEARKTAAQPISSGVCSRFIGVMSATRLSKTWRAVMPLKAGFVSARCAASFCQKSVQRTPGQIAFTVTPCGASSLAMMRVRVITPILATL